MGEEKRQKAIPDVDPVTGYEETNFTKGFEILPPMVTYEPEEKTEEHQLSNLGNLSEEECREALLQHVSENFCYGKKCAENMEITKAEANTALHYHLTTFTEGRKTKMKKKPYKGGSVDGPENGPAPLPWDILCAPSKEFHGEKVKKTVPHTDKVVTCKDCDGKGYEKCNTCHGNGSWECDMCEGTGKKEKTDIDGNTVMEDCFFCEGSKRRQCPTCGGDGKVTCEDCEGYKMLKCFVQLKVKYKVHEEEYIRETTDMPDELVTGVEGNTIFEQTAPAVYGLANFPHQDINENSCRLAAEHKSNWPAERILMQRQVLRGVPVTEVHYKWDDTNLRYWVYGTGRRVYAPDYPQQQCWGCNLL